MTGKILGETWRIYKQRFGIMLFFAFIFFGLGYTLLYGVILAASQAMIGFSMDVIGLMARLLQGVPFEDLVQSGTTLMNPNGMDLAAMPLMILLMLVTSGLEIAYGILAVPMGMGGLTVLATGEKGPLGWRDVFRGLRQRYGKLVVTYLCHMVYTMAAGFALMFVYLVIAAFASIAALLINLGSAAGIVSGVVLITLLVLVFAVAILTVQALAVFIMPAAVFDRQYYFKAVGQSMKLAWKHFLSVLWVQLVAMLLLGFAGLLLFGVFLAFAWHGPDLPVYAPLWYACLFTLIWPFSVILNGVLYRHLLKKDAMEAETVQCVEK